MYKAIVRQGPLQNMIIPDTISGIVSYEQFGNESLPAVNGVLLIMNNQNLPNEGDYISASGYYTDETKAFFSVATLNTNATAINSPASLADPVSSYAIISGNENPIPSADTTIPVPSTQAGMSEYAIPIIIIGALAFLVATKR